MNATRLITLIACSVLLVTFAAAQMLPPSANPPQPAQQPPPQQTAPPPQPAPPLQQSRRRDLARYTTARPLIIGRDISKQARHVIMQELRGFLWQNWQARRHAQLTTITHTIAEQPVTSTLFIEEDERGRWRVTLETDSTAESFNFVEQITVPEDGPPELHPRSGTSPRRGVQGLHLKHSAQARAGLIL